MSDIKWTLLLQFCLQRHSAFFLPCRCHCEFLICCKTWALSFLREALRLFPPHQGASSFPAAAALCLQHLCLAILGRLHVCYIVEIFPATDESQPSHLLQQPVTHMVPCSQFVLTRMLPLSSLNPYQNLGRDFPNWFHLQLPQSRRKPNQQHAWL